MLRTFVCGGCGESALIPGGTTGYHCQPCRERKGMPDLQRPQYLAHQAVSKARSQGLLPDPKSCHCADCGAPAIEYDHRDYSQPLVVDPVCRRCNLRRGPAAVAVHTTASA